MTSYRLRLLRKRGLIRAACHAIDLKPVIRRTASIKPDTILLVSTVRNEARRLPYFLDYYRRLGVGQFLFVDNASTDETGALLADQPDVSLWTTSASYRRSRYGIDWSNWLLRRYAHGHWALTVDADEFFVYPFCDVRPLRALTDWLDGASIRSFGTMLVDTYPKPGSEGHYRPGDDPFNSGGWFDTGNYTIQRNPLYGNLWIQGGPRARAFFAAEPHRAPALNKIPLVKWHRKYVYVSSTHSLLPRGLNLVYDEWGGEKATGCLLHPKFLDGFEDRFAEEVARAEHFGAAREYRAYSENGASVRTLWNEWSEKYVNWRQLEMLGLMSKGNWA